LRFDRYLEPSDWVAQLPMNAVGMNVNKFVESLGPTAESDADRVYWTVAGVGFGKGATVYEAYIDKGRIIGFKAAATTDFDSTTAVRDALTAKLKSQPTKQSEDSEYSDTNRWEWKRRVPVTLEQLDTDRFSVTVGKTPWD
jgi:hypothetical protein